MASTRAVSIPMLHTVGVDGTALAFTLLVAIGTGLLFGIVPALQVSGREDHDALKDSSRGSSEGRRGTWTRNGLMVAEVALASMLIVGDRASVAELHHAPRRRFLGFQPRGAAAWRIETSRSFGKPAERVAYHEQLVRAVEAIPGVESVGLTDTLPLSRNRSWGIQAKGVVYQRDRRPSCFHAWSTTVTFRR